MVGPLPRLLADRALPGCCSDLLCQELIFYKLIGRLAQIFIPDQGGCSST